MKEFSNAEALFSIFHYRLLALRDQEKKGFNFIEIPRDNKDTRQVLTWRIKFGFCKKTFAFDPAAKKRKSMGY